VAASADPAGAAAAPVVPHAASAAAAAVAAAHRAVMRAGRFTWARLIVCACIMASLQVVSSTVGRRQAGRIGAGPHTTLGDQFAGYADQIRRIVESKWRTDLNVQSAPVVIARFDLMRDGSVRNLELVQRSGVTALDNSVLRAIQDSVFPPIPPEFTHSYASIEFTFDLKQ